MFYTIKLGRKFKVSILLCVFLFAAAVYFAANEPTVNVLSESSLPCLVIDAGHGGIDGGAIALDGTKESEINLIIAKKLHCIADFMGKKNIMTRTDDSAQSESGIYSEHKELVYRTEMANSIENAVLISIHQNCYPTSQPWGAQVLYSADNDSMRLGKITHDNIISFLEPSNRRVAEPAAEELYITSNAKCPTILVECGFISNFSDLEKLTDSGYQSALSVVLMASYLQFIGKMAQV